MLRESYQLFDNHIGRPIGRCSGFLLVVCFFLGAAALAMHHHDVPLQLKGCAICKVKASFSGTFSKIAVDFPAVTAASGHGQTVLDFTACLIQATRQSSFITALLPNPFLNRAPPAIS